LSYAPGGDCRGKDNWSIIASHLRVECRATGTGAVKFEETALTTDDPGLVISSEVMSHPCAAPASTRHSRGYCT